MTDWQERIEGKLDKLVDVQTKIQVDISKLQVGYAYHVKRTDRLEEYTKDVSQKTNESISDLDSRVSTLEEPGKVRAFLKKKWVLAASILGSVATILGILKLFAVL